MESIEKSSVERVNRKNPKIFRNNRKPRESSKPQSLNRHDVFVREMAVSLTRYLAKQLLRDVPDLSIIPQEERLAVIEDDQDDVTISLKKKNRLKQRIDEREAGRLTAREFRNHSNNVAQMIEAASRSYANDLAEFLFAHLNQSGLLSYGEDGFAHAIPLDPRRREEWFKNRLSEWSEPYRE